MKRWLVKRWLGRLDDALSIAETALIALLSIGAFTIGIVQVVLRYAFNTGFSWAEAMFVVLTVAAMLVAASRAVREDAHVRVDLVPMMSPPPIRRALQLLAHVLTLGLCAYYCFAGIEFVGFAHMMETASPDTGIPDWIVWLVVPVTMGAICVRYVIRIVRTVHGDDIQSAHSVAGTDAAGMERRS